MYLTYEEYKDMGGSLDESQFNRYAVEASYKIREATFGRIKKPSDAVKDCMMRLVDLCKESDPSTERVSSFSHDGLNQTFQRSTQDEVKRKTREIIRSYLINEVAEDGTPLMYCGVKFA